MRAASRGGCSCSRLVGYPAKITRTPGPSGQATGGNHGAGSVTPRLLRLPADEYVRILRHAGRAGLSTSASQIHHSEDGVDSLVYTRSPDDPEPCKAPLVRVRRPGRARVKRETGNVKRETTGYGRAVLVGCLCVQAGKSRPVSRL